MIARLERGIFFLTIFFFISQLGKHFWPSFSYVEGIRVDYLSPTVYITDILIFFLFCLFLRRAYQKTILQDFIVRFASKKLVIFGLCILLLSTFFAFQPLAAFYGLIKVAEFSFFGWYIAQYFQRKDITPFIEILAWGALFSSLLAFVQFALQRNVGGIFYFLGERVFTASTPHIAVFSTGEHVLLRPYASFPHPNVLAFFLFVTFTFALFQFFLVKQRVDKVFFTLILFLSGSALLLTFSRVVVLLFFFCLGYFLIKKRRMPIILPIVGSLLLYFGIYANRFFNSALLLRDSLFRFDLIAVFLDIISSHFLFGVGLLNFFYYESTLQKEVTATFLQPVHNIFLLVLVQVGVLGLLLFLYFLFKTGMRLYGLMSVENDAHIRAFYRVVMFLFVSMLVIGCFDHFLLTLQQGQFLFATIMGLAWTNLEKEVY